MSEVRLKSILDNDFYKILQVKYYYFSGLAARLKVPSSQDPAPLIEEALKQQKRAYLLEENAAYIQNKLTISPHTVKSHIYSIYRKLDIHSQQKLMDFVEDYPTETQ